VTKFFTDFISALSFFYHLKIRFKFNQSFHVKKLELKSNLGSVDLFERNMVTCQRVSNRFKLTFVS
jgi:hypothetical protein